MIYYGACHCKRVTFKVEADDKIVAHRCDCSICDKTAYLHLIVPKDQFELLSGKDQLSCYQFNEKIAKHYFCATCGIKSFYIPRSNPDGVSVNVRCLEPAPKNLNIEQFDGQNWEANAHKLSALSKPSDR